MGNKIVLLIFSLFYVKYGYGQDTINIVSKCAPKDTITSKDNFVSYKLENDAFYIYWGNKTFRRRLNKSYSCDIDQNNIIYNNLPIFKFELTNYLGFIGSSSSETQTSTNFLNLLPLNDKDSVLEFENYLNHSREYIVSSNDISTIYVYNITTKNKMEYNLYPFPILLNISYAIRKIQIQNKLIYIEYESCDNKNNINLTKKYLKITN